MIPIPTDETLMAYADGELDPAVSLVLENAMVRDPMIAIRTVEFIKSRRVARAKFESQPLPEASAATVDSVLGYGRTEPSVRGPRAWLRRPRLTLLAASLALGAGALAAFSLLGAGADRGGFAALGHPQMEGALNEVASGESVDVAGGRLRAVATVALKDSRLCRQIVFTDPSGVTRAVVCRSPDRVWQPVLALSASDRSGDYRPASGNEVMDRFFEEEGGGPALEGADEKRALGAG